MEKKTLRKVENKVIRIKDIAVLAKVSAGTVDRVIHKRGRVAEEVKERVIKIIKELNYEPNLMAKALGSKKQFYIAALIPDHKHDIFWKSPKAGIEKAEKELKQYGVVVEQYIFDSLDVKSYIKKANELTLSRPDGILLSPLFYRETLPFFKIWQDEIIPFVLFNTQITDFDPLSYIGQDSYQSGMLAGKLIHYGQPEPCAILVAHIDEEISNAQHLLKKELGLKNYFVQQKLDAYEIKRIELDRADRSLFFKNLDEVINHTINLKQIFVTTSKAYDIAQYLEQKNLTHIKLIGYDLVPQNIHYLQQGKISFLINQNPKGQGYFGVNLLAEYLIFKKDVPLIKYLPLDIVTNENLDYFLDDI